MEHNRKWNKYDKVTFHKIKLGMYKLLQTILMRADWYWFIMLNLIFYLFYIIFYVFTKINVIIESYYGLIDKRR